MSSERFVTHVSRMDIQITGRGDTIRTCDLFHPMEARYQTAPRPDEHRAVYLRNPVSSVAEVTMTQRRDWLGALTGIATFLVGIALLGLTFKLAFDLFTVPPEQSIGLRQGQPIDVNETLRLALRLVVRILMLLFMCFVASLIASRGIKMYSARRIEVPKEPRETPSEQTT